MSDSVGKKAVFEREPGQNGLGWSLGHKTENLVDPTTGAHTQTIASFWHVYVQDTEYSPTRHTSILSEQFVWRNRCRKADLFM